MPLRICSGHGSETCRIPERGSATRWAMILHFDVFLFRQQTLCFTCMWQRATNHFLQNDKVVCRCEVHKDAVVCQEAKDRFIVPVVRFFKRCSHGDSMVIRKCFHFLHGHYADWMHLNTSQKRKCQVQGSHGIKVGEGTATWSTGGAVQSWSKAMYASFMPHVWLGWAVWIQRRRCGVCFAVLVRNQLVLSECRAANKPIDTGNYLQSVCILKNTGVPKCGT